MAIFLKQTIKNLYGQWKNKILKETYDYLFK